MSQFELSYKQYNERSILVEWPSKIDTEILYDLLEFKSKLEKQLFEEIVYVKCAYNSLLVFYKNTINNIYDCFQALNDLYEAQIEVTVPATIRWSIPVCYDPEFAIDMAELTGQKKCSSEAIIAGHSESIYTVFCIGFLPGFVYLGGLKKELHFPRRPVPRLKVQPGTVGIGGEQTGVYPIESPGGWNIIGNTPVSFFNMSRTNPCFISPGDQIKFYPVDLKAHHDIRTLDAAGVFQLQNEVIHD